MTTKVSLSSLVGHTPVTVRFDNGDIRIISAFDSAVSENSVVAVCDVGFKCYRADELVEVLPAKQTPTPLTDYEATLTATGLYVMVNFARKLELERAALLALVERVADGGLELSRNE